MKMNRGDASMTSPTLLGRLKHDATDQAAWQAFVKRYGPKIRGWCCRRGLPDADAADITQNVLLILVKKMKVFNYDPTKSFRGYLRSITHHAILEYLESRDTAGVGGGNAQIQELLRSVEAHEELATRLKEEFDLEHYEEAVRRVQ